MTRHDPRSVVDTCPFLLLPPLMHTESILHRKEHMYLLCYIYHISNSITEFTAFYRRSVRVGLVFWVNSVKYYPALLTTSNRHRDNINYKYLITISMLFISFIVDLGLEFRGDVKICYSRNTKACEETLVT